MSIIANRVPVSRYRPPMRTRDLPLPPRWVPREKAIAQQRLMQFVVLSMLLHALAILLFGAPTGGSREGRAIWGSLRVVLRPAPAAPAPVAPPVPEAFPQMAPLPDVKIEPLAPPFVPRDEVQVVPLPDLPNLLTMPPLRDPTPLPPVETVPTIRVPTPRLPTPLVQPMPTLTQPSPLPRVEAVPTIRVPVETPRVPTPLLQPIQSMPEGSALPPVDTATRIEAPPQPVAPPAAPQPVAPARTEAPATRPEAPRAETPRSEAPRTETPRTETPRTEAPPGARPEAPVARPREEPSPFRAPPQRDSRDYDPTKPALDVDQLRKRAGELQREGAGNRALLPFPMPPVPKKKTKMEEAIENARKPDCREAYKALGLAAVVPLIANEFGEGNCRW